VYDIAGRQTAQLQLTAEKMRFVTRTMKLLGWTNDVGNKDKLI